MGVFLEQSVRGQQAVRHDKEVDYSMYFEYIIGYISTQSPVICIFVAFYFLMVFVWGYKTFDEL